MQSLFFEVLRKGPLGLLICRQMHSSPLQAYFELRSVQLF